MSLYLLLAALQADAPLDPPPLKIKPVVVQPQAQPVAPTVNPTIIYMPAKPAPVPSATPGVTYAPAKPDADPSPTAPTGPLASVSDGARQRLAVERQADAERRAELRQEMTAVNDAIAKALSTEPLDVAALKVALERRDEVMAKSRAKVTDAVLELLGDIAPGDRMTIARALIDRDSVRPSQASPQPQAKPDPSPVGR